MFDDIQAKAVQYYKASPATATSKSSPAVAGGGGGVATPLPEAVQILEAKLEASCETFHSDGSDRVSVAVPSTLHLLCSKICLLTCLRVLLVSL